MPHHSVTQKDCQDLFLEGRNQQHSLILIIYYQRSSTKFVSCWKNQTINIIILHKIAWISCEVILVLTVYIINRHALLPNQLSERDPCHKFTLHGNFKTAVQKHDKKNYDSTSIHVTGIAKTLIYGIKDTICQDIRIHKNGCWYDKYLFWGKLLVLRLFESAGNLEKLTGCVNC